MHSAFEKGILGLLTEGAFFVFLRVLYILV